MLLALFEPDIPQNTGSLIRLCACMGVGLHIIEPCGFPLDDKRLRRVAMDYYDLVAVTRHSSWQAFREYTGQNQAIRLVLLTTKATQAYTNFRFQPDDILLLGRESAGVPDFVRSQVDGQVKIPVHAQARSINVAMAASMVLGEALRQTGLFIPDR
jgi:tRNA (cytidine/uridine-2'-O-)-methyltransferase